MSSRSGFHGVYPMAFALFDDRGELSRSAMRKQIEAMVRHKVHGIGILGLASEVNKLSLKERIDLMHWVIEDVGGALPVAVTIAEPSVTGQVDFAREAASAGASWLVLQPPPVKGIPERELIRFFGAVAEKSTLPIGIQNAPEYLGIGLSPQGLKDLHRVHSNFAVLKLEATALAIADLADTLEGSVDIFNGRDGIELVESLRAGAVGVIPGGEAFDVLARIYDDLTLPNGEKARAQRAYSDLLPLLNFLMASMDTFLVYGKQVLGERLGLIERDPRVPSTAPSPFGLQLAKEYAAALGPL